MKKALALCGGGAKGSYEAGCFKALNEIGEHFDIVTGTSIGCLNAAMYCQGDFDRDYELWEKLNVQMIMKYGFNFERYDVINGIRNGQNSINMVLNYMTNRGADIRPLRKLIDEYIDVEKIKTSDVTFGIVTASFPSMKGCEIVANKLSDDFIKDFILASASCWPVFPVCKIDGKSYVDGGYYDNLPINYALRLGAQEVVAIDLNMEPTHKEYTNTRFVRYIKPTHNLGTFMQFDHETIMNNMTLGYLDTMKSFKRFEGYRYTLKFEELPFDEAKLVDKLLLVYSYCQRNLIKNVKKAYQGSVLDYLSEYTVKRLTKKEFAIRAIEVFAELMGVDYFKVYSPKELIDKSLEALNKTSLKRSILDKFESLKTYEKKRALIEKVDDIELLRYLSYNLKKDDRLNVNQLSMLYTTKMDVFISYVLLDLIL